MKFTKNLDLVTRIFPRLDFLLRFRVRCFLFNGPVILNTLVFVFWFYDTQSKSASGHARIARTFPRVTKRFDYSLGCTNSFENKI